MCHKSTYIIQTKGHTARNSWLEGKEARKVSHKAKCLLVSLRRAFTRPCELWAMNYPEAAGTLQPEGLRNCCCLAALKKERNVCATQHHPWACHWTYTSLLCTCGTLLIHSTELPESDRPAAPASAFSTSFPMRSALVYTHNMTVHKDFIMTRTLHNHLHQNKTLG